MKKNEIALFFLLILLTCFASGIFAQEWNKSEDTALAEVLQLLSNPLKRTDQSLQEFGGKQSEELYQLAAKIFESLVTNAQGNIDQVEKVLKDAQKNPAAFLNNLSPELKINLKKIASKIEKRQSSHKP